MNVRELGKTFVSRTAPYPAAWSFYKFCGRLSNYLANIYGHAHYTLEIGERDARLRQLRAEIFPDDVVAGGPFAGMRWCDQPFASALLPKLLGSYERELHPSLEEMFECPYSSIVDIGCAEGYYAIGMALRFPKSNVYAFDTDPHARRLCMELSRLNGVENRVHVSGVCDQITLKTLALGKRALIISDCEGYEDVLFTRQIAEQLTQHDFIIEVHDFVDIDISTRLRAAFAPTHHLRSVKSVDDIEKAHTYSYPQLSNYDTATRRIILSERRPCTMEWLVIASKTPADLTSASNRVLVNEGAGN
jgi:hypothetical protein